MTAECVIEQAREGYHRGIDPKVMALILLQLEADLWHGAVEEETLHTGTLGVANELTKAFVGQCLPASVRMKAMPKTCQLSIAIKGVMRSRL